MDSIHIVATPETFGESKARQTRRSWRVSERDDQTPNDCLYRNRLQAIVQSTYDVIAIHLEIGHVSHSHCDHSLC